MKVRKVIAVLLATSILLTCCLLSACAPAPTTSPGTTTASTATTAKPSDTTATTKPVVSIAPADELAYESAKIDWKQFSGKTLRVMYCNHPYQDAVEPLIPEFEELTGIDVSFEKLPEQEFWDKLMVEFSGGVGGPDVFMINAPRLATFDAGGWIEDLRPYLQNSKLTDPDWYDSGDFYDSAIDYGKLGEKQYGLPITGEWQVLFYRKDLYEAKGLSVPKTMQELYDNAVALNSPEVAGIVNRFSRNGTAWWPWAGFVGAYNTLWVDNKTGQPQLTSDQVKKATKMYIDLVKDAGPAGIVSMDWYEALTEFQQGRAAHFADASVFMADFENPEKSQVSGKVGYAAIPIGEASQSGQFTGINYWLQGISAKSENKDAAWLYLQWATSKKIALEVAVKKGTAARSSIWENESFLKTIPLDFAEACAAGAATGNKYTIPEVKELGEIAEFICIALNEAYMGEKTLDKALEDCQAKTLKALGK